MATKTVEQELAEPLASETPLKVHEAWAAVMADVQVLRKDQRNTTPGQSFMYRGVDQVMNLVGPVLRKHGVFILPKLIDLRLRDAETTTGKAARESLVQVEYTIVGPDGNTMTMVTPGESMDSGDKGGAKAMSVAYRIALLQALCLPTDEIDPDATTWERAHPNGAQREPEVDQRTPEEKADVWVRQTVELALGTMNLEVLNARATNIKARPAFAERDVSSLVTPEDRATLGENSNTDYSGSEFKLLALVELALEYIGQTGSPVRATQGELDAGGYE